MTTNTDSEQPEAPKTAPVVDDNMGETPDLERTSFKRLKLSTHVLITRYMKTGDPRILDEMVSNSVGIIKENTIKVIKNENRNATPVAVLEKSITDVAKAQNKEETKVGNPIGLAWDIDNHQIKRYEALKKSIGALGSRSYTSMDEREKEDLKKLQAGIKKILDAHDKGGEGLIEELKKNGIEIGQGEKVMSHIEFMNKIVAYEQDLMARRSDKK